MGAYNSTYVGIYLEIPFYKTEKTITTFKHPVTGKTMKSKFCGETGAEAIVTTRIEPQLVEPSYWIEDQEGLEGDTFWQPAFTGGGKNIATFVLNGDKEFVIDNDGDLFNLELNNINISDIIEKFTLKYAKYIQYYENLYEVVNVKFGVVNYAH